jgi:hypothetical protein
MECGLLTGANKMPNRTIDENKREHTQQWTVKASSPDPNSQPLLHRHVKLNTHRQ